MPGPDAAAPRAALAGDGRNGRTEWQVDIRSSIGSSEAFRDFSSQQPRFWRPASDATVLCSPGRAGPERASLPGAPPRPELPQGAPVPSWWPVLRRVPAPTLVESALFGHERGAFTDAHSARSGLFPPGRGGSLVLDDIDLLPLALQAKLLRVLQERVVEPLGAEASVPVDVRVIATTNRPLAADVEAGAFRADLYYRLAVVTLEAPPLRVRLDDLEELVEHLTRRSAARLKLQPRALGSDALEKLRQHGWPGNVRELENAIERVLVLGARGPRRGARPGRLPRGGWLPRSRRRSSGSSTRPPWGWTEELAAEGPASRNHDRRPWPTRCWSVPWRNIAATSAPPRASVGLTRRAFDYRMGRGVGRPKRGERSRGIHRHPGFS